MHYLKNSLGNSWDIIWIPYHDRVDGALPISFHKNTIRSRYPESKALGLSQNSGKILLDIASFRKLNGDGSPSAKNRNVNA